MSFQTFGYSSLFLENRIFLSHLKFRSTIIRQLSLDPVVSSSVPISQSGQLEGDDSA